MALVVASLMTSLMVTGSAKIHPHLVESTSEKVIVVIEEALEGVPASEELAEDLVCGAHVEVELLMVSSAAASLRTTASSFKELSSVLIVVASLLLIAEDAVRLTYSLKNFFCFLLIVRILIRVVLERELAIGLLDALVVCVSVNAENLVEVLAVEVWS